MYRKVHSAGRAVSLSGLALLLCCTHTGGPSGGDGAAAPPGDAAVANRPDAAGPQVVLTVVKQNLGGGTVTSAPPGVQCGATTCSGSFAAGATVTLSAQADDQSIFERWGGACSGPTCSVTLGSSAVQVTASFLSRVCDAVRPELPGVLCPSDPVPGSATLSSAWASGPADLWAVGEQGVLWRYDGFAWYQVPLPTRSQLLAVSGTADNDVWIAGFAGTLLHYDGTSFTQATLPAAYLGQASFYGVWAGAANDVWAVGGGGAMLHLGAAGSWTAQNTNLSTSTPITSDLYAVMGSEGVNGSDVWAAGAAGALWRWSGGSGWRPQSNPASGDVHALWVNASSDVWAAGFISNSDNGAADLLHYNGTSVTVQGSGAARDFYTSLWGRSASEVYASGSAGFWRWSGAQWSSETLPAQSSQGGVVIGDGTGEQLLRTGGLVLRRDASGSYTKVRGRGVALWSLWSPAAGAVWAVGEAGTVLIYNGQAWQAQTLPQPTAQTFYDVWGSSASDVWLAGSGPTLLHYQGGTYTQVTDPALQSSLFGVFGTAANNVWFVGGQGAAYHYTGGALQKVPTGVSVSLLSIAGSGASDLWAVGPSGTIVHYTGASWQTVAAPTSLDLYAVWASGPQDAWIAGDVGTLLHYDGSTWSKASVPQSLLVQVGALRAVGGSGPQDVWVVGSAGVVLQYNGQSWSLLKVRATSTSLQRVIAVGSDRWMVDNYGGILRYH